MGLRGNPGSVTIEKAICREARFSQTLSRPYPKASIHLLPGSAGSDHTRFVAREYISQYYLSFIDNEAAEHALARGYGSATAMNQLMQMFWSECDTRQLHQWLERVSSAANLADAVSCDDLTEGLRRGWKLLNPDMQETYRVVLCIRCTTSAAAIPRPLDACDSRDQGRGRSTEANPDGDQCEPCWGTPDRSRWDQ